MPILEEYVKKNALFYVTRDVERALGLPLKKGMFIISNLTEYSKKMAFGQANILLIDEGRLLDTWELLEHPKTQEFINQTVVTQNFAPLQPINILVFKNTTQIERICSEKNYTLLNPSATLSQKIEEKISQVEWLSELSLFLPPHKIQTAKEISFDGPPFILQFNRAHTGLGTMLIELPEQLHEIQTKFPNRPVRFTQFIDGPMLTSNNVVTKNKILVGNISYQITGLQPFTENPFATIGNDWNLSHKLLNAELKRQYVNIVESIGNKLRESGWKGLFGVDVVLDQKNQKLYLIEINARQPASTTFESQLQTMSREQLTNDKSMTTFEAHIYALLDIGTSDELIKITDGAQIIQRVNSDIQLTKQFEQIQQLEQLEHFQIIPYENTDLGSDWIRIQSLTGLMKEHEQLNERGLQIAKILSP